MIHSTFCFWQIGNSRVVVDDASKWEIPTNSSFDIKRPKKFALSF